MEENKVNVPLLRNAIELLKVKKAGQAMTTFEVRDFLATIVEADINSIANVMGEMDFNLDFNEAGEPAWLI